MAWKNQSDIIDENDVVSVHDQIVDSVAVEPLHSLGISRENPLAIVDDWMSRRDHQAIFESAKSLFLARDLKFDQALDCGVANRTIRARGYLIPLHDIPDTLGRAVTHKH